VLQAQAPLVPLVKEHLALPEHGAQLVLLASLVRLENKEYQVQQQQPELQGLLEYRATTVIMAQLVLQAQVLLVLLDPQVLLEYQATTVISAQLVRLDRQALLALDY
jgi:hypothetical protein